MTKINDGGAAFPNSVQPDFQYAEGGMSLRDWFAGQALTAVGGSVAAPPGANLDDICAEISKAAYLVADAMLKAREGATP